MLDKEPGPVCSDASCGFLPAENRREELQLVKAKSRAPQARGEGPYRKG